MGMNFFIAFNFYGAFIKIAREVNLAEGEW